MRRQEAAPITYVENRSGDATRERRCSLSLFLSHGTERSFRSGVNIYARAITAHLNETSVPIVYDEGRFRGLECRRKKKTKKKEHEEEEDEEEKKKKKQEKKKTKKEQPRSFHAKWRFRSTGITLNLRIG